MEVSPQQPSGNRPRRLLNEGDKILAGIAANIVPGTFQVTNNLRVVKS